MKIRAEQSALSSTVAWVARAVPKRPTAPVLSGMRLRASGTTLTVSAFDYEVSHEARLEVDVRDQGECLVSGQFVREIVGALKGKEIELVLDGDHLTISSGRASYRTQVLALDDYPALPIRPPIVGTVAASDLVDVIAAVRYPIDDASPHENVRGLRMEGRADELTLVGASRFILMTSGCDWSPVEDFDAVVPVAHVEAATKGLAGKVTIRFAEGRISFTDGARTITARTFVDKFAPWQRLIRHTTDDEFSVTAGVADLLEATKRISLLAASDSAIALCFEPDEITLALTNDAGGNGTESVEADCAESAAFGMSPAYLAGALAAIPGGAVAIGCVRISEGKRTPSLMLRPIDHPRTTTVLAPRAVPGGTR